MTPLQQTLMQITIDVHNAATIRDSTDWDRKFAEIGIDSLDAMSVMLEVMERFDIQIPSDDVTRLSTLNELARFVEAELNRLGRKA
ncbi:MAG: Acyl carrier protein [Nitrosomonadaceae bacterium]|nr:Acyl carrier protein [Nitrosomonadaceae bacterium]